MTPASDKISLPLASPLRWLRGRGAAREWTQTIWVVGDQAIVSLASFLTTVIVGRIAGREELGIYVLGTTTFWLLAGIPNALAWTPYTSRAPRMSADRRARYSGSVTMHMAMLTAAIIGALLLLGLMPPSWFGQGRWFATMCLALVPFTAFMMLREHVRRICLSQIAARDMLVLDAPIAATQLLLLLWLARWDWLTANTALLAVGAACLISTVWLVSHHGEFRYRPRHANIHWSYNLQFGRWLLAVSIAWLLGDAMYRWIVGWQYGLAGLGQLAGAQAVVLFINPLLLTAVNFGRAISANRYAAGGASELRRITFQATVLVTIVAGIAFLALALVGGPLVKLIFGNQFAGLGGVVAALCLGMLVRIASVPVDASLTALQQGRALLVAMLVQLAVIVVAGIPLIARFGLPGVGYTMVFAYGATAAVEWYCFLNCVSQASETSASLK